MVSLPNQLHREPESGRLVVFRFLTREIKRSIQTVKVSPSAEGAYRGKFRNSQSEFGQCSDELFAIILSRASKPVQFWFPPESFARP